MFVLTSNSSIPNTLSSGSFRLVSSRIFDNLTSDFSISPTSFILVLYTISFPFRTSQQPGSNEALLVIEHLYCKTTPLYFSGKPPFLFLELDSIIFLNLTQFPFCEPLFYTTPLIEYFKLILFLNLT